MCGTTIPGGAACPHCVNMPPAPNLQAQPRSASNDVPLYMLLMNGRIISALIAGVLVLWTLWFLFLNCRFVFRWYAYGDALSSDSTGALGAVVTVLTGSTLMWVSIAGPLFVLWYIVERASRSKGP